MDCTDSPFLPLVICLLCKILKCSFCFAYNPITTLVNLMKCCMQIVRALGCHVIYFEGVRVITRVHEQ